MKSYKCNLCEKRFTQSGNLTTHNLTTHKRSHTEVKPFKCDLCDKGFTKYDHLNRHKIIHMVMINYY